MKFGFICFEEINQADFFKIHSERGETFSQIFDFQFSNASILTKYSLSNEAKIVTKIEKQLYYLLSIRNNYEPDYGINWRGRFNEQEMFHEQLVLGRKLTLFNGNEDNLISFLANIHNVLNRNVWCCFSDNITQGVNFIKENSIISK